MIEYSLSFIERAKLCIKRYALGFSFSTTRDRVVLIRKSQPGLPWHLKLNGLGGRIETNTRSESALQCMVREFREEAGIDSFNWTRFAVLFGDNPKVPNAVKDIGGPFEVHCFSNFSDAWRLVRSVEPGTEVKSLLVRDLAPEQLMNNCNWLIPMALSMGPREHAREFIIQEVR